MNPKPSKTKPKKCQEVDRGCLPYIMYKCKGYDRSCSDYKAREGKCKQ
jgi:hypothetical protein